jgi:hypothetical protein
MNAIEKLKAERQNLVDRLGEIDRILGQYAELERIAESYFATGAPHTSSTDSVAFSELQRAKSMKPIMPMPTMRKPKTPMADFARVVVEVLSEAQEPLDRSALYKALIQRDVVIGSPDERSDLNTLSARMSRMQGKIVNVSGYGYWLRERAFPPGGYEPEADNDLSSASEDGEHDPFV